MKELSIEQKAKAYDEAKARISRAYNSNRCTIGFMNEIFPEFEESEDERIRGEMISYFKQINYDNAHTWNGINLNKFVAWLEKQKNIDVLDEEEREFADNVDSYRKEIDAAYQKGYNEGVKITLEKHGEQKPADKVEPKFNIGDIIFNKKTKERFAITDRSLALQYYHDEDHLHEVRFSEQDDWEIIKPKFHKSDWVFIEEVDGHRQGPFQIKEITQYGYTFFDGRSVMPFECESLMTLWAIADAKDGDVLATDQSVFIYAKVLYNKAYAYCGVDKYGVFKDNCLENNWTDRVDKIHPATKEQRDTLERAMADARYTFDFEKKKLEQTFKVGDWVVSSYGKVNQVFAVDEDGDEFTLDDGTYFSGSQKDDYHLWTIQDIKDGDVITTSYHPVGTSIFIFKSYKPSTFSIYCYYYVNSDGYFDKDCATYYHRYGVTICPATKEQRDTLMKAMADAGYTFNFEKKELKKIEQKLAEWSKEDEEYLNFVIATMKTLQVKCTENEIKHHSSSQAAPYYAKVINWLKSLKPQKQKWSEKDTEILNGIANYLFTSTDVSNVEGSDEWYDWLKSLKNRVQKSF